MPHRPHDQAGSTTQRETNSVPPVRLYNRILTAMQQTVRVNPTATIEDLAATAAQALTDTPRKRIALALMAENEGKPACGICHLRIFLDEPDNSPAAFTVDHITRWADGGQVGALQL